MRGASYSPGASGGMILDQNMKAMMECAMREWCPDEYKLQSLGRSVRCGCIREPANSSWMGERTLAGLL